jgi:hypothetical protein
VGHQAITERHSFWFARAVRSGPVVPTTFSDFFAASAGVAGALIGLLFVAISVAPDLADAEKRAELDVRAGVAFSALVDALVVALFALIPGANLGTSALVVASTGFASCIALGIVLMRTVDAARRVRQLRLLIAQAMVFVVQFIAAFELIRHPADVSIVRSLSILVVGFFIIGIARAWQMIGARDTGLFRVVREAIRERSASPAPTVGPDHSTARE